MIRAGRMFLPLALQRPWARDPSVRIYGCTREGVVAAFSQAAELLAKSLTVMRLGVLGRIGVEDLYRLLTDEVVAPDGTKGAAMQLFLVLDEPADRLLGACVTEIIDYPRKRVLSLAFLGGVEMERWLDGIRDLEFFAKDSGCQQVEIPGRPGWSRVFKALGYEPITYTCAKELR